MLSCKPAPSSINCESKRSQRVSVYSKEYSTPFRVLQRGFMLSEQQSNRVYKLKLENPIQIS